METAPKIAIIIVDLQNDFADDGALPVKGTYALVPTINKIIKDLGNRAVVITTQDWHPLSTPHFDNWPVHCVAGSKGAEIVPDLDIFNAVRFFKGQGEADGYSAFSGTTDGTEGKVGLHEFLVNRGLTTLYICGVATDYCVKATVLDAIKMGFYTYLVTNAIAGVAEESTDKANTEMAQAGVIFMTLH